MKKLLLSTCMLMLGATTMFAQDMAKEKKTTNKPQEKKRASPHETVSGGVVKVTYGRPYKKGRDIFGGLEAYGKVWRVGADEATEITFDKGVVFGGRQVSAGTYTMFATPEKTEWTIILNKELGQWGAYGYDKVKDKDVAQVKVPVKNLDHVVEQLTITPKEKELVIEWDKTQVVVPIQY